jgi:hypothetical protein
MMKKAAKKSPPSICIKRQGRWGLWARFVRPRCVLNFQAAIPPSRLIIIAHPLPCVHSPDASHLPSAFTSRSLTHHHLSTVILLLCIL